MTFPIDTPEPDVHPDAVTAEPAARPPADAAPADDATLAPQAAAFDVAGPQTSAPVATAPEGAAVAVEDAPRSDLAAAAAPAPVAPADCGPLLKKTFPALFAGAPKPLKLRIQIDIQERAPGVFTKQALSAFFRRYTGSTSYLIAVSRARQRFDLDGQAAGELSEEHRQIATDELARRRGNQESRVALEAQQRRNRATLLHDFERTTLTPANFCALKGIAVDELDGYLATARREAAERPLPPPAFDAPRRAASRPPQRADDRPNPRPDTRPDARPGQRRR